MTQPEDFFFKIQIVTLTYDLTSVESTENGSPLDLQEVAQHM